MKRNDQYEIHVVVDSYTIQRTEADNVTAYWTTVHGCKDEIAFSLDNKFFSIYFSKICPLISFAHWEGKGSIISEWDCN